MLSDGHGSVADFAFADESDAVLVGVDDHCEKKGWFR